MQTQNTMKAEAYLIKHNLDKTYWGKKIIAAEKRGRFTDSNCEQAFSWQTCACGKQDKRIPRDPHGEPFDSDLADLGAYFYDHVGDNDFHGAAVTLNKIEKRAAIVLRDVA